MTNLLRFLQVFALGTWVGAIIYLSFVVAPGVFGTLSSRDQAGAVVGLVLGRLHVLGLIAAAVYVAAAVALWLIYSTKELTTPAVAMVVVMAILTLISQHKVTPQMAELRHEMVSVDATPRDNPLRVRFDQLHRVSVQLEGAVLLIGIGALWLTVTRSPR
jgi:uncharacterized membrane protein